MIKHKRIFNVALVLVIILTSLLSVFTISPAYATGWLSGWNDRKALVINYTADGAQTNYQLKLTVRESSGSPSGNVSLEGHGLSSFNDLRFTTVDGTTLCDYWIESTANTTPNQLATVWIEIPSIAASPTNTTIYMYYGNAGASAVGLDITAGKATFPFFDDFNNGTTLDPQWGSTNGTPTVASGVLTINANGEFVMSTYNGTYQALRFRANFATGGGYHCIGWNSHYNLPASNNESAIYTYPSACAAYTANGSHAQNDLYNWTLNAYSLFDVCWCSTSVKYYDGGGAAKITCSNTTNIYPGAIPIEISNLTTTENLTVDWIFSRNYTANEPTWNSFGSEEALAVPTVTTQAATGVTSTNATVSGNITVTGGNNSTERGICYSSTNATPSTADSKVYESGNYSTGTFSENLTGLTQGVLYYASAYAINMKGTGYGSVVTFLTLPLKPTSFTATGVNGTQVNLSWTIGTGAGKTYIIGKLGSTPTNRTDGTWSYNGTASSVNQTGLTIGQHWYYDAWSYVTAGGLTQYSDTPDATADAALTAAPSMTTNNASSVNETTGTLSGNVTAINNGSITTRGFQWGTSTGVYTSNWTEDGTFGVGNFTHDISSLTQGTLYYFRSCAYNSAGLWGYGSEVTLLTIPLKPTSFLAANASLSQINLSWTKGTGAGTTYIIGKLGGAPTNRTDGTYSYNGTASSVNQTGVSAGDHWYYLAWSYVTAGGLTQYSNTPDATADCNILIIPLAPTGFTAKQGGINIVTLNWTTGTYAATTLIMAKQGGYPSSATDGFSVYSGNATTTNVTGLELDMNSYYFSAFSYNAAGYSLLSANTNLGGSSMILIAFLGFALIMSFFAFTRRSLPLSFVAGITWILLLVYTRSNPIAGIATGSYGDTLILFICILMFAILLFTGWRKYSVDKVVKNKISYNVQHYNEAGDFVGRHEVVDNDVSGRNLSNMSASEYKEYLQDRRKNIQQNRRRYGR